VIRPFVRVQCRQLLEDGFLIVRGMIPPERLGVMREAAEAMVERTKAESAAKRMENQPPGGWWFASAQPRVNFGPGWADPRICPAAAPLIEFCLGELMEFTRQMFGAPEAAPLAFNILCSAENKDWGPMSWHRDIHPVDMAPLDGLQQDVKRNGPYLLQWNLPLYDDRVLWVVPGSHFRRSTPEETEHGLNRARTHMPGGVPVDLKAGDGVIYINMILHWGSHYSTRLRRTIHPAYRQFGGKLALNHLGTFPPRGGDTSRLSQRSQALVRRCDELWAAERDLIEQTLRTVLAGDAAGFRARLAQMHPGRSGRMVTVVILSKIVIELMKIKDAGRDAPFAGNGHNEDLAHRFTREELSELWDRFEPLDRRLRTEELQFEPMFQSGPMHYHFYEMPERFGLESFIKSWSRPVDSSANATAAIGALD
jgi:hypothetical protein